MSDEMRLAFKAIPAGILFVNRLGLVELANKSARDLFQKDIEGSVWRTVVETLFEPQKDDGLEVSLVNGRKVKFAISNVPGVPGQLIHLTDLTQTRTLQAKVSHMQRLSALGKMVASLAHQLRTPLSAALLYARNLQAIGISAAKQRRFSDKLIAQLKGLERQINDMLLFAKSGKQEIIEDIHLASLVETLVDEIRETVSDSIRIDFRNFCKNDELKGNRTAICGAINNLLQNAIAVGASQIELQLDNCQRGIQLSIADNGPGIPKQQIKQIFEPFFTTRAQGTGLGLSVVRSVMFSHQGRVSVVNQDNGGAKFTLLFPPGTLSINSQKAELKASADHVKVQIEGEGA
ncbi:sensor histidine kinase [Planctobacterium marinum]|uniref:histidine kinase n=1 Tax=Planctobacterium marinum TaxID=1631968 RepID=A0AA48KRM7_9ALTE|nr:sensor histidine kinase [Planctobacterium marinum]